MRFSPLLALALLLPACSGLTGTGVETAASDPADDPYLWLEEVEGERPLAQVRAWNAETAEALTANPKFEDWRARGEAILSDPDRLALPASILGDRVTNFWTDETNTHGLWRIATIDDYLAGTPMWRTLLDLDELSRQEGRNWVWGGATCLAPDYQRCLVSLSDGGSDKDYLREFDVSAGRFVDGGFRSDIAAKHSAAWVGRDTLLLSSDFGEGTLTDSEYGRQLRLWQRGTDPANGRILLEVDPREVGVSAGSVRSGGRDYPIITRSMTFWDQEYSHVRPDGTTVPVPIPQTATLEDIFAGEGIVLLNADWGDYRAGSLVAYDAAALVDRGEFRVRPYFTPEGNGSIQSVAAGSDRLYLVVQQDVKDHLLAIDTGGRVREVMAPDNGIVSLEAAGGKNDIAFFTAESFAQAPRVLATQSGQEPAQIQALDPVFDPASISVEQRFATSSDGTRIPYFVVRPAGATGPLPTVLHAYGGFRITQTPEYLTHHPSRLGPMGLFWVQEGGSFVLANIRGGNEYGPAWHDSVLRENRQLAFDDLYAVAEDLKASNLSSTVAASGRSNGGLLVGVAYTQRPDLFDGIVMGVPLSDMYRYDKMLAGASWVGEYGDPDDPADWAFIGKYSPYQNLRPGGDYPPIMIYTSTKDDRVHPGHARKMAARIEEYGYPFYYYENIEGGHAGAANAKEEAYRAALVMSYASAVLK